MNKILSNILVALTVTMIIAPMLASSPGSNDASRRKKAQYALYEAMAKKDADDIDAARALLNHALSLDPDDPTINFYSGYCMLALDGINQSEVAEALQKMSRNTYERPGDFYENYLYANLCAQVGNQDEAIRVMEMLLSNNPQKTEIFPTLAKCYASKGDYQKAIATIDSLELHEGKSMDTYITKLGYMFAAGDTVASFNEGRAYLREAPESVNAQMLMGSIYQQFGQNDSAFVYYNKALAIDPDYGYANLQKAKLYNQIGDSVNFEREITATLVNRNIEVDTKVDILTDYIRVCINAGDSSRRIDNMFGTILRQHPHEAQIHKLYSDYLTFKKDYSHAAEQLSYTLDINPADSKSWERLMWLYIYIKKPEEAISTGRRALEYLPDEISYYQILGSAHFQMEEYAKSIEAYDTLLQRNKEFQVVNEADIYTAMAESWHQQGDTAQALACYTRALDLDPENVLALNNYAYYLCINYPDSLDEAERMSRKAVLLEDDNASYLDTYAWIMFLKRDYKKALEYIEKAAEAYDPTSDNSELWEHYGDILFMLGRPDEALEKWNEALKGSNHSKLLKKKIDNKAYFYE